MAKNNKRGGLFGLLKTNKKIKSNLDILDNSLHDLYSNTYFTSNDDENTEKSIRKNIDDNINDIMNKDYTNVNISNMTKMYNKLSANKAESDKSLTDALEIFNDKDISSSIVSTWMQTKWVRDLDSEIDMILKYMPKLKEALACRKDCVLSADHFSKDFITYHSISNRGKEEMFGKRMEELKRVYKLSKNYEDWYDKAQTYGEAFVYTAPYSKEFERILSINKTFGNISSAVVESGKMTDDKSVNFESCGINNITINFNVGIMPEVADNMRRLNSVCESGMMVSMKNIFEESTVLTEASKDKIQPHIIADDLEVPKELDDASSSVEIIIDKEKDTKEKITVPGAILKTLDRDKTIPFYIEDICLGYYYIEVTSNIISGDINGSVEYLSNVTGSDAISRFNKTSDLMNNDNNKNAVDLIVNKLAEKIDRKFINANQDMRKELYAILKHSSLFDRNGNGTIDGNVNITFLSPDDVTHIYFKQDPITKRGISDLAYSLFPAKLYTCLYITTVLGQITRGQDKRVYYVKQNVETNISKTLLNVINQIKKGNMGARQMENLGNILNITGKFNDLVIPLSPSGDSPVQFEVMPGQQFTDNSELMTSLEKMSIDPIIPYDLVEARQSLDYAIQATMSNSKLMRATYNRQDIMQGFYSTISSNLFNYEYGENETIDITLPAPTFLNMTNGSQLINGTIDYINTLITQELAGEDEEVQNEFRKIASRYYMPTHLNINLINKFVKEARMAVAEKSSSNSEEEE